jgi:hypothetical protein
MLALRPLSLPATALIVALGVWIAGGWISDDFRVSMALTAVVRLADGRRFATLTGLMTSPGPDLRVRLQPGDSHDGGAPGAVDLGRLKGNRGDQQYAIPPGVRVGGRTLVIWCRAFSAPFGSARLT